jgi:hypothetical protein
MRKFILVPFLVLFFNFTFSQELNCEVTVNYDQLGASNTQIFKSLQTSLKDFVNNRAWTDAEYKPSEKINCSMFISVKSLDGNNFEATIQVQSSRTIFNSSYSSPVVNINDKDFNFSYIEFENLSYNQNSFDSNLMSVLAFYCYYIIGADADTFEPNGGDKYYQMAQDIVNMAATSSIKGWLQTEKRQNRYYLINDALSQTFKPYRDALYSYHFEGLDMMEKDPKASKDVIKSSLMSLKEVNDSRPNAYVVRTFFDAKSDEIVSIFSGGPQMPTNELVDMLGRICPSNANKWSKIK